MGVGADELRTLVLGAADIDASVQEADQLAWGTDLLVPELPLPSTTEIAHPLSAHHPRLSLRRAQIDQDTLTRTGRHLRKAVADLTRVHAPGSLGLFHRLWQWFPAPGVEGGDAGALPADRRVASRSWRIHAGLTAALAGCLFDGDDPAILVFTVASAQDFISAARRTQDFWMGSYLLSHLMWQAIRVVAERFGPDSVLVPSLRGQPQVAAWLDRAYNDGLSVTAEPVRPTAANFGNVFTAIVPARLAAETAERCVGVVRREWADVGASVRKDLAKVLARRVGGVDNDPLWMQRWTSQLPQVVDQAGAQVLRGPADVAGSAAFWAFVPWRYRAADTEDMTRGWTALDGRPPATSSQMGATVRAESARYMFTDMVRGAGRLLTARKRTRDFNQIVEEGWRCTLCGTRSALVAWDDSRQSVTTLWAALATDWVDGQAPLRGRIRPNEQLCGACVTKRLAWDAHLRSPSVRQEGLFPSVSTVAAAPFLERLATDAALLSQVKCYVDQVEKLAEAMGIYRPESALPGLRRIVEEHDNAHFASRLFRLGGDWWYPETFEPEKLARENGKTASDVGPHAADLTAAREALATLTKQVKPSGAEASSRPSDYFAILRMDGDGMGKWLSGAQAVRVPATERLHSELRPLVAGQLNDNAISASPAHVASLSEALGTFSGSEVPRIVEETFDGTTRSLGLLVFAGGDELLALVPAARVLRVAEALRTAFQSERSRDGRLLMGPKATITAGVVFVHRESPLVDAVEAGKDAAKVGKETLGGDALVVRLVKRSGDPLEVVVPWDTTAVSSATAGYQTTDTIHQIADLLRRSALSAGFVTNASRALAVLPVSPPDAIVNTMIRLGARHTSPSRLSDAERDFLLRVLPNYYVGLAGRYAVLLPRDSTDDHDTVSARNPRAAAESFRGVLLLSRFLAGLV
jgi:CRISPR-associated protein Cmr2